jgi:hypothetical protein
MYKKIVLFIITGILLFSSNILFSKEEKKTVEKPAESNLAEVVILSFENKTGSKNYDWMKSSLSDAIYESMKQNFEFKRLFSNEVEKGWAIELLLNPLAGSKEMGEVAARSSADIIIFGKYTYDKKKKMITISTEIFHSSRKKITGKINILTKIDTSLFRVVDDVAVKCIKHITVIALEDIAVAEKLVKKIEKKIVTGEKKEKVKKKSEKIVLVKAKKDKVEYDSWLLGFGVHAAAGTGMYSSGTDMAGGLSLFATNSPASPIYYGVFLQASLLGGHEADFDTIFFASVVIHGGYNFKFFDRIYVRPYAGLGYSYTAVNYYDGTTAYDDDTYMNPVVTAGVQMPVRYWGDNYIAPFIEYFWLPGTDFAKHLGMIKVGLQFSF